MHPMSTHIFIANTIVARKAVCILVLRVSRLLLLLQCLKRLERQKHAKKVFGRKITTCHTHLMEENLSFGNNYIVVTQVKVKVRLN